jgi:hypothetical protein
MDQYARKWLGHGLKDSPAALHADSSHKVMIHPSADLLAWYIVSKITFRAVKQCRLHQRM